MRTHLRSPRFRRALTACLALAATLIAASAPFAHAAAHAKHDIAQACAHVVAEVHAMDDRHGEVHAPGLHDDSILQRIQPNPLMAALPEATAARVAAEPEQVAGTRPVHRLRSRAPPPGDPARAPPFA